MTRSVVTSVRHWKARDELVTVRSVRRCLGLVEKNGERRRTYGEGWRRCGVLQS
jgi:hypothetical protein